MILHRSASSVRVLALLGISVALGGCARSTPEPSEPLPDYRISFGEAYGAPGTKLGNKYWITLPIGTPETTARRVVEAEARQRWTEPVLLDGASLQPTELTFFVYNQLDPITGQPPVPGQSLANLSYEWTPSGGPKLIFGG